MIIDGGSCANIASNTREKIEFELY
jgi:hypothetical protein